MKKLLLALACVCGFSCNTFAQKGVSEIGAHINYGTKIESVGLGVHYRYGITDAVRLEPSASFYFKKDGVSMFDLGANVHYLIPLADKLILYPLAGAAFSSWRFDGFGVDEFKDTASRLAVNLGGGLEVPVSEHVAVGAEVKYQIIKDLNQLVVGLNLSYKF